EANPVDETESVERVKAALAWQYPFPGATTEIAKSSVSALRRRREEADDEAKPLFQFRSARRAIGRRAGLSATDIGNAHHLFLQLASLEALGRPADLSNEAARLRDRGLLSAEEVAALDVAALARFWESNA